VELEFTFKKGMIVVIARVDLVAVHLLLTEIQIFENEELKKMLLVNSLIRM